MYIRVQSCEMVMCDEIRRLVNLLIVKMGFFSWTTSIYWQFFNDFAVLHIETNCLPIAVQIFGFVTTVSHYAKLTDFH